MVGLEIYNSLLWLQFLFVIDSINVPKKICNKRTDVSFFILFLGGEEEDGGRRVGGMLWKVVGATVSFFEA